MSKSDPKIIKQEGTFSTSGNIVSHKVEAPELSIIEEAHTIPTALESVPYDDDSHRSVGAGLLQAMMKQNTSQTTTPRNWRVNGSRIPQSANSGALGKRIRDAAQDEHDGLDLDDSDSSSTSDRQIAPMKVEQSFVSQLPRFLSPATGSISTSVGKRRRVEGQLETKQYHDECHRRNVAPKLLYEGERQALGILKYKPWLKTTQQPSNARAKPLSGSFAFPSLPLSQVSRTMIEIDTMSLKDRKRFFIYTPTESMKEAMQAHVSKIHRLFPPTRKISDCMLHPNPGQLLDDGKYNQVIPCKYRWTDPDGPHRIQVNFGLVALIVNSHLTAAQKEGFIEHAWHLSHLCGNWICCNWRHHTVEPGPVNIGRNACFSSSEQCTHKPPCMKDKKQVLSLPTTQASSISQKSMTDADDELWMLVEDKQDEAEVAHGVGAPEKEVINLDDEDPEVIVLSSDEDTDAEILDSDEDEV